MNFWWFLGWFTSTKKQNLEMSTDQINHNVATPQPLSPTCMESVNRVAKLPVVESGINVATSIYEHVKEFNSVTNWTLSTAENTVNKVVEVGKPIATPVIRNLEGPIRKVDGMLCTGLDYVENKVPAVKLPPGEIFSQIYNSTKEFVSTKVTPAVENAYAYAEPSVTAACTMVEPAVQSAKNAMEPAVEKARIIVEPYVQPAVEKAQQVIGDFLHGEKSHQDEDVSECEDCKNGKEHKEHKKPHKKNE